MPGFDRSGPKGQGAMTGRAMGRCAPKGSTAQAQDSMAGYGRGQGGRRCLGGRGRGLGRGRGRSMGMGNVPTPVPVSQAE